MVSEPDDNPFARNSAWPKMPQAPFRVGPLPKANSLEEGTAPAEPPRAITPVFVRPNGPAGPIETASPLPEPRLRAPETPASPPTPTEADVSPPARAADAEAPAPVSPPEPYIEVAPVIVQPLGSGARRAVRKSPVPTIAATAAGIAAILGIAYALNRGQEAALDAAAAGPPASSAAPVAASSEPAPPAVSPPDPAPAAPANASAPAEASPTARSSAPPTRKPAAPKKIDLPPPAPAADEGMSQPILSLPPAPSRVATPEPAALPSYTPPAAPDPTAPVSNQRRD